MLGLGVAIDDFGTGYSSLSYLQRFPATAIKIARDFVAVDEADADSWELASAIVSMGRALRLTVIAEGVEEPFQLGTPAEASLQPGPGVLPRGRAAPADELEELFSQPRASNPWSRTPRRTCWTCRHWAPGQRRLTLTDWRPGYVATATRQQLMRRSTKQVLSSHWAATPAWPTVRSSAARLAVTGSGLKQGKPAERRGRKARDLPRRQSDKTARLPGRRIDRALLKVDFDGAARANSLDEPRQERQMRQAGR